MKINKKLERLLINSDIRTLYSEGFSSMKLSLFNANLSFNFANYIGKNKYGYDQYDVKNAITTSINYYNASLLYKVAMSIDGEVDSDKEVRALVSCNNANLLFEYKSEQNNQKTAYLTIEKNNQSITFRFPILTYQFKKDGQIFTKVVQVGVNVLTEVLHGYLSGIGCDKHLEKLADYYAAAKGDNQQRDYSTENSSGYQGGSW